MEKTVEVDPVTGYPKDPREEAEKVDAAKISRLDAQKAKADQLQASLNSETGKTVLQKIHEHLLARINTLIDQDPECKAYKRLLVSMGNEINMGEVATAGLMRLVMKK